MPLEAAIIRLTFLLQWWDEFRNTAATSSRANNTAVATQLADLFMKTFGKVYCLGQEIYLQLEEHERPPAVRTGLLELYYEVS